MVVNDNDIDYMKLLRKFVSINSIYIINDEYFNYFFVLWISRGFGQVNK